LWRYTFDDRRGKWTKTPYQENGCLASSTASASWATFEKAVVAYQSGQYDGLGFVPVPDDHLTFLDLDDCLNRDGTIHPEAASILGEINSYCEVTPSGAGFRCICHGHRPSRNGTVAKLSGMQVEVYDGMTNGGQPGGKYLAVTGHRRQEYPADIQQRQQQLEAVYHRLFPHQPEVVQLRGNPPPPMPDDEVLQRACEAANGEKFRRLWHGDLSGHASDASRADQALIAMLTFWTWDPSQLDRLFRRSKLLRPKWDEIHGRDAEAGPLTYGQMTIRAVLINPGDCYQPAEEVHAPHFLDGLSESAPPQTAPVTPAPRREVQLPASFVPFPTHLLPGVLRAIIEQTAAAVVCDPTLAALPALAVVSAAIGMSRAIRVRPGHDESAAIWTATIAEIGTGKTPSHRAVVDPYFAFEIEADERRKRARDEYEAAKEARRRQRRDGPPPEPLPLPTDEHVVVSNTTLERLIDILNASPRGVLFAVDELNTWFGSHTRYSSGQASDTPHWLSLHDGVQLSVSRKTFGTKIVKHPFIALCGSIQPEIFSMAMANPAFLYSGLLARLLISRPPEMIRRYHEGTYSESVVVAYSLLLKGLRELQCQPDGSPIALGVMPEAKALFQQFYDEWHGPDGPVVNAETSHARAACIKAETAALRLALLIHVVKQVEMGLPAMDPVHAESMAAGIALGKWFGLEAVRVYGQYAESPETREIRQLCDWIKRKDAGKGVTPRDLHRANRKKYPSVEAAKATLDNLVNLGLATCKARERTGPGNLAKEAYSLILSALPSASPATVFPFVSSEDDASYEERTNTVALSAYPISAHDSGSAVNDTACANTREADSATVKETETQNQSNEEVTCNEYCHREADGKADSIPSRRRSSEPF
jgi:hypothetical protein